MNLPCPQSDAALPTDGILNHIASRRVLALGPCRPFRPRPIERLGHHVTRRLIGSIPRPADQAQPPAQHGDEQALIGKQAPRLSRPEIPLHDSGHRVHDPGS